MVLLQGLARISQSPSSNALKVEGEKIVLLLITFKLATVFCSCPSLFNTTFIKLVG